MPSKVPKQLQPYTFKKGNTAGKKDTSMQKRIAVRLSEEDYAKIEKLSNNDFPISSVIREALRFAFNNGFTLKD